MTSRLELTQSMVTCPLAWQHFFDKECEFGPRSYDGGGVTTRFINKKLKPWGAKYDPGSPKRKTAIVFESEAYKAFFILKWN